MREIVEAAGVTKPVLYYYFPNKEGIYLEMMRGAWDRFDALLEGVRKEFGGVKDRVLRLADLVFGHFLSQLEVARVGYSIYYGPPQGAPFFDFDAFHNKFHEVIEGLVREGIRKKEFRKGNALDMTWAILGAVHVAVEVQLWHPETGLGRKGLPGSLNCSLKEFPAERTKERGLRMNGDWHLAVFCWSWGPGSGVV